MTEDGGQKAEDRQISCLVIWLFSKNKFVIWLFRNKRVIYEVTFGLIFA